MTNQKCQSHISTGNTGWISIHINDPQSPIDLPSGFGEHTRLEIPSSPVLCRLFEHAEDAHIPLPERFPRLTFLAIAIALLASALTAEFDYLRGAGYFWP